MSTFAKICSPISKSKEIAITFDDSPREAKGYLSGPTRSERLIKELKNHKVRQVVFFSNSSRLDSEGIERLQAYGQAGHIIANHTHDHPDFNKVGLKAYTESFLIADSKLSQFKGLKKLFRFPCLREGNDLEKRDGMRAVLKKYGYINAYKTLNNYDWHIETLFQNAISNGVSINHKRMAKFYSQVMIESIEYYDAMARTSLGRSPKHVLLLHETDISALYIGDLVDELRRRGWKIISPEEAYMDEIAEYRSPRIFPYNPGRIGEIARYKGQRKGLWHQTLDEQNLEKRFLKEVLNSETQNSTP